MLASSFFISVGMTPTSRSASPVVPLLKIVPPTPNASIPSLMSNPCNRSASKRVWCCSSFSLTLPRYLVSDVYPPSKTRTLRCLMAAWVRGPCPSVSLGCGHSLDYGQWCLAMDELLGKCMSIAPLGSLL